jgi:opacity protein-like surface antigen
MKKISFCSVLALLMCMTSSTHAEEAVNHGIYVGIGFFRALDYIDEDEVAEEYGIAPSGFDDSWGFDFGGGYQFTRHFALEAHYSYLDKFESSTADADVSTFLVKAKFIDRFYQVRPFVSVGLGFIDVDFDLKTPGRGSESEFGPCASLGVGLDVILTDNVILGPKVGYVIGFSDVSSVGYLHFSLGLDLHF